MLLQMLMLKNLIIELIYLVEKQAKSAPKMVPVNNAIIGGVFFVISIITVIGTIKTKGVMLNVSLIDFNIIALSVGPDETV